MNEQRREITAVRMISGATTRKGGIAVDSSAILEVEALWIGHKDLASFIIAASSEAAERQPEGNTEVLGGAQQIEALPELIAAARKALTVIGALELAVNKHDENVPLTPEQNEAHRLLWHALLKAGVKL